MNREILQERKDKQVIEQQEREDKQADKQFEQLSRSFCCLESDIFAEKRGRSPAKKKTPTQSAPGHLTFLVLDPPSGPLGLPKQQQSQRVGGQAITGPEGVKGLGRVVEEIMSHRSLRRSLRTRCCIKKGLVFQAVEEI